MQSNKLPRRKFLGYAGLATTGFLVAAGCDQTTSDAPVEGVEDVQAESSESKPKVRVGFQTGDINNVTMVAYNKGYFEEVGLDVELIPFSSGGTMVPALAAGEVDVTWFFPFPSLSAYARGIPIEVFLLDHAPRTAERLIAKDVTQVSELTGKNIGVTIGTSGHHSLLAALVQANVAQQDVNLLNLQPAEMTAAFTAGQLDAAWTWEPAAGTLNEMGGKDIATAKSVGAYAVALWAVRKPFVEANPEAIQRFIEAWDNAQQDYLADIAAGQKWEAERLNLSTEEFADMVDRQSSEVILVTDQLSHEWLGEPGNAHTTDLYKAYEEYAIFLKDQGRIDDVPDDLSPLINSSYIKTYLDSK
jgi:taurine ABC transporter substrate-binding protein